jgi:hypothetical protein
MKSRNKELENLSLKVFGKRYEWRKLTKRGLNMGGGRRMPLTLDGAKHYMETTLKMQDTIKQEMETKNETESSSNDS